jgi:hypothetical protein
MKSSFDEKMENKSGRDRKTFEKSLKVSPSGLKRVGHTGFEGRFFCLVGFSILVFKLWQERIPMSKSLFIGFAVEIGKFFVVVWINGEEGT